MREVRSARWRARCVDAKEHGAATGKAIFERGREAKLSRREVACGQLCELRLPERHAPRIECANATSIHIDPGNAVPLLGQECCRDEADMPAANHRQAARIPVHVATAIKSVGRRLSAASSRAASTTSSGGTRRRHRWCPSGHTLL